MQVYLEPYGKPARERLQTLVAEAKAGNPFAPVTVVPPNTYSGIGLRRVLAGDGGLLNVGFMALHAWPNNWVRRRWRHSDDGRCPQRRRWLSSARWRWRWWGRNRSAAWRGTPRCTNRCMRVQRAGAPDGR